MARVYNNEIARLTETFDWAAETDIGLLRKVIRDASQSSLRAIGSGGSLTTAHALCYFHQIHTEQLAAVATPLEAISTPLNTGVSHWLLTARGNNVDILAAARILLQREPRLFAVLCGNIESELVTICRSHPFTELLIFQLPTNKDGFLATNSLFGFATLIARAYAAEFGYNEYWLESEHLIRDAILPRSVTQEEWQKQTMPLWKRPTTLVLYGPTTHLGAIDLESKFTEAGIGNIQIADYRNFAHGRHHWLAKHGQHSSVLAFITDSDRTLAERTLSLIPSDIPQVPLKLPGNTNTTALLSLVAALHICGYAGNSRGIDPGRPGVPSFGRKLYRLTPPRAKNTFRKGVSLRDLAAISRKSGISIDRLRKASDLSLWKSRLDAFRFRLFDSHFAGLVLDYDGTLVGDSDRSRPPAYEITKELIRLLEEGVWIGIATGRGVSVRRDLQTCLPPSLWERVRVGYYNGAEIAGLSDNNAPDGGDILCDSLRSIAATFRAAPELSGRIKQTDRRFQITLEPIHVNSLNHLWEIVQGTVLGLGISGLRVFRSSHSIDVVAAGVSKTNILSELRQYIGSTPLLAIGDKGRWPGNDCELLQGPYSLSVDESNADHEACWNLGQPGQRGPIVALDYIDSLEIYNGNFRFVSKALQ